MIVKFEVRLPTTVCREAPAPAQRAHVCRASLLQAQLTSVQRIFEYGDLPA